MRRSSPGAALRLRIRRWCACFRRTLKAALPSWVAPRRAQLDYPELTPERHLSLEGSTRTMDADQWRGQLPHNAVATAFARLSTAAGLQATTHQIRSFGSSLVHRRQALTSSLPRNLTHALIEKAELDLEHDRTARGRALLRLAIVASKGTAPPRAFARYAKALRQTGKLDQASQVLALGRELQPAASIFVECGDLAASSGEWDQALVAWEQALSLDGGLSDPARERVEREILTARFASGDTTGLSAVATIVPYEAFGFDVEAESLDSEAWDRVMERAWQRYRSDVQRLGSVTQIGSWNLLWSNTFTLGSDSMNRELHLYVCEEAVRWAFEHRRCGIDERPTIVCAVALPAHARNLFGEICAELGIELMLHPEKEPLSLARNSELSAAWRARSPSAGSRQSQGADRRERHDLISYLLLQCSIGTIARACHSAITPDWWSGIAWIHTKPLLSADTRRFEPETWTKWRLSKASQGYIDGMQRRLFYEFQPLRRSPPLTSFATALRLLLRGFRSRERGAIALQVAAPARHLPRRLREARRIRSQLMLCTENLAEDNAGPGLRMLTDRLRERFTTAEILSILDARSGAASLWGQPQRAVAVQADAISKESRLWTAVARQSGVPVVHVADRILGWRRLSNAPQNDERFDTRDPSLPDIVGVFDTVSLEALNSWGFPRERVQLLSDVGANKPDGITGQGQQGVLGLYLQAYIDDLTRMIEVACDAARDAGLVKVVLRPHPHFPISSSAVKELANRRWPEITLEVSTGHEDRAANAQWLASGYSTALLEPALHGRAVIWLRGVVRNEWFARDLTDRVGFVARGCRQLAEILCKDPVDLHSASPAVDGRPSDLGARDGILVDSIISDTLDRCQTARQAKPLPE